MNLADGKISKRQWFRMSYLECVTISMMMIPYITLSLAGKYHVLALVVGARICRALWSVDAVSCGLCSMRLYQCDSESYGMDCRYIGRAVCLTVSAACDAHRGLFLHDFAAVSAAKLLCMVDIPAISWNHIVWCVQVDGRTRTDV